jgi:lipoprotein-anchoring transpeptidase ErfK/SrfK
MNFARAARLTIAFALAGCAGEPDTSLDTLYYDQNQSGAQPPAEVEDEVSYWDGAEGGAPSITINLTEQRAYFFKGSQLAGVALVATGKEGYGTPAGTFRIMEKIPDKVSNLYGWIYDSSGNVINYDADIRTDSIPPGGRFEGASMPYWMRLTSGGVGMHQGVIPVPGSPASHGCIRTSKKVIAEFFANARVGTPVRIVY